MILIWIILLTFTDMVIQVYNLIFNALN